MKTHARLMLPLVLLAVGLWACQDQVVTPEADLQTSLKKPPAPPDPSTIPMWVGFLHPDMYSMPGYPFEDSNLDISADPQLIDVIVDEYGELQIPDAAYQLSLHFQDELSNYVDWCESRLCDRRSNCPITDGFNMLQELQNASAYSASQGHPLIGRLVFSSTDQGGVNFETTLEVAGDDPDHPYRAGEYVFSTCWLNCGGREHGFYPEDDGWYPGWEYWRILNAPVRVYWRELGAKKNDPWTHRTTCGNWPPGINRGGMYEVVGLPAGG